MKITSLQIGEYYVVRGNPPTPDFPWQNTARYIEPLGVSIGRFIAVHARPGTTGVVEVDFEVHEDDILREPIEGGASPSGRIYVGFPLELTASNKGDVFLDGRKIGAVWYQTQTVGPVAAGLWVFNRQSLALRYHCPEIAPSMNLGDIVLALDKWIAERTAALHQRFKFTEPPRVPRRPDLQQSQTT